MLLLPLLLCRCRCLPPLVKSIRSDSVAARAARAAFAQAFDGGILPYRDTAVSMLICLRYAPIPDRDAAYCCHQSRCHGFASRHCCALFTRAAAAISPLRRAAARRYTRRHAVFARHARASVSYARAAYALRHALTPRCRAFALARCQRDAARDTPTSAMFCAPVNEFRSWRAAG